MQKGVDYTGVTVVFMCHDGNGRFIMSRRTSKSRDEAGKWDIGGGGLEFDEQVTDCLKREIKEEYTTDVLNFKHLGFRDAHRVHKNKTTHWIALDFLAQVNPATVSIGDPEKIAELAWFSLDNLPPANESHSMMPIFWDSYLKRLEGIFSRQKQYKILVP